MEESKEKETKCSWPKCEEKNTVSTSLQLLTIKDGKPVPVQGASLSMSLCTHHMFIASSGMFAILEMEKGKHKLIGPIEIVDLIETTIGSMIATGKFRELMTDEVKAKEERAILISKVIKGPK